MREGLGAAPSALASKHLYLPRPGLARGELADMGLTDWLGGKVLTPEEFNKEAINEPSEDCGLWVQTGDQRRQGLVWAEALRKASWRRDVKWVLRDL